VNEDTFKQIFSLLVFTILLIPVVTYPLLDLQQQKTNELILEQERVAKEAEERVYLTGRFEPSQREDFIAVPTEYDVGGYKMYLRKETMSAFLNMAETAEKDGVELKVASATRNFDYQKNIWNNKWTGVTLVDGQNLLQSIPDGLTRFKKILEYSAAPGTSRHHWGTDIDINGATPEYFNSEKGENEYNWLIKNAPSFGFCQTYNLKGSIRSTGYNEEKWHWTYLPLSKDFTQEYKNLIKDSDISGFDGDEYVSGQDLIDNYVLSINPDCL
jgi:LAS superfamily LD-carboxypeptidase LdcB